ncbi:DNA endonuclease SmrA [Pseudoteredinibacter isoporae]|uniref:DNA-nicking Smr family endonuclease n=1 Tax=Pseudoteredinibacter isoporae TaxID=570281 RepID=A0A7X0MV25_9GAMM|nr:DNA endonuclease SmrA [Pseudoteredinibacter isoporae]MBB6520635.1 DNA-nicking Smr family endonuclease [Pseudoteredinibacter isoporae]NHO86202.1 DNA endonuclease SmrA [Pseudoteredinibacter isoporae]NIB25347.1 DNA endonuclease SmrA [Pseudoteredinibacter isoporae]
MSDDEDFFRQSMADVQPIKQPKRVNLKSSKTQSPGLEHRKKAAVEEMPSHQGDPLSDECIEPIDPLEIIGFQRPGVQHGVYKNLRLGKYQIEARLDLHHMTIEQGRRAVYQFVKDCLAHDIRCSLITHGKGEGRQQSGLLKSAVAHWLPQIDAVLAFHSAQKHHGGAGATYVMLKKSDRKRQENMERFSKR